MSMDTPPKNEFTPGDEKKDPTLNETGKSIDTRFTEIHDAFQDSKLALVHKAQRYVSLEKELSRMDKELTLLIKQASDLTELGNSLQKPTSDPKEKLVLEKDELADDEREEKIMNAEIQYKIVEEKIKQLEEQYSLLSKEHDGIDAEFHLLTGEAQEFFQKTISLMEYTDHPESN